MFMEYFARDPKYSRFHEHSKNWIHFLNNSIKYLDIYIFLFQMDPISTFHFFNMVFLFL